MSLKGLRVLVTRPAHQAEGLCAAIDAAGGHALRQPLLAIKAPVDPEGAARNLAQVSQADDQIFTSANAVDWAWRLLPQWRPEARIYAVGRATAQALRQYTSANVHQPDTDYSSEGLLALPELAQPQGREIGIITGEAGRQKLEQTLQAQGAKVTLVSVYRRQNLPVPRARLEALLGEVDMVFVSSAQSLEHLHSLTPAAARSLLYKLQLVVPSARVVKRALELGFSREPIHPERMHEDAIVAALQHWVDHGGSGRQ